MIIGGLQKTTLVDYPGKVSCAVFLSGCNFSCPYCHNPDLAKGSAPESVHKDDLLEFLDHRRGLIDGVVISGGEPTLHPELLCLCRDVRHMGYAVKLDTNGSRPEVIDRLLQAKVLDYVAMDIKTDEKGYATHFMPHGHPDRILKSIHLLRRSSVSCEFRTTCVHPFVSRSIIEQISIMIEGADRYVLQRFRPETVLNPAFFQRRKAQIGESELTAYQRIAEGRIQQCIIR